jgi:urease accessory protein UreF
MAAAGSDERTAATAYGAGFVGGQAMAGVRLGIIGQGAAQRIIAALRPDLLAAIDRAGSVTMSEMGAYLPLVDLAGLAQPGLASRLFGS